MKSIILAIVFLSAAVFALENGLARVPPMVSKLENKNMILIVLIFIGLVVMGVVQM